MKRLGLAALAILAAGSISPALAHESDVSSTLRAGHGLESPREPQETGSLRGRHHRLRPTGAASWYGPGFQGRRTANGERFNTHAFTAAHRSLPFGTRIRVTNTANGRSIVVRINDRGPYVGGRVIDLSQASARAIGIQGVSRVHLSRL
jgi:rare lipoprotein A